MRATLKVAELATFIYAILVFGSMCIEMAYFTSFDISIAAYLQISEILFMFLSKPLMYIPLIIMIIMMLVMPGYRYNDSKFANIKTRYIEFSNFSLALILLNSAIIFAAAYLYEVFYAVGVLFSIALIMIIALLPNPLTAATMIGHKDHKQTNAKNSSKRTPKWKMKEYPWVSRIKSKYKSELRLNKYKVAKERYRLIETMCSNSFIYGVLVSYLIVVVGLSFVNLARAGSYIDNELSPKTVAVITTIGDKEYVCDNEAYFLISESADYIFLFDRTQKESIVIPRNQVLKTSYSLKNKTVMSKRGVITQLDSLDSTITKM